MPRSRPRVRAPSIALTTKRISERISFFVVGAKRSHSPALRLLVSASRLHFVSVVSKPTSTGCRETVGAEQTSTGRLAPVYRSNSEEEPLIRVAASCLHFVSVVSKLTSTGCRETIGAELQSYICVIIILMIQLSYVDCLELESDNRR